MTTPSTADFRIVLRGLDPVQVESRIRGLEAEIERLRADVPLRDPKPSTEPATYEHLGRRMMQILQLATDEADELRGRVRAELAQERARTEEELDRILEHAEVEADRIRADARDAATATIDGARISAADLLDAADREAAARRRDAESLLELQRTRVAEATAEFEQAMAERRAATDAAFREAEAQQRSRLDALERRIAEQHDQVESGRAGARAESRRILEEAQLHAASLIEDAQATADRIRAESEREIALATQRRDAVHEQLAALREALAGLASAPDPRDATVS